MDNRRLILVVALGFVLMLLWQAWTRDQQQTVQAVAPQTSSLPTAAIPEQALDLPNAQPKIATPNPAEPANAIANAAQITVRTDVLSLKINPRGGVIDAADLLRYPQEQDKAEPVNLLNDSNGFVYIAQSGLLGDKGSPAPDHYAQFQSAQSQYQLQPGQNELRIPLTWEKEGIKITKWFIVKRGDYAIKVEYQIDNTSNQPWQASQYRQLTRLGTTPGTQLVHTYTGGVYAGDVPGSKDRLAYEKVSFEDMAKTKLNKPLSNGWVAIIEHYFLSAWIPANPLQVNNFYTLVSSKNNQTLYTIGMSSPVDTIAAGSKGELSSTLYVGPKIQSNLAPLAQGLNLTIDYGIFTVIADPIFWLLKHFHEWVG
ncbi:MAG: membrane protein insertase YidC, partial [Halothiobacillus sp.]